MRPSCARLLAGCPNPPTARDRQGIGSSDDGGGRVARVCGKMVFQEFWAIVAARPDNNRHEGGRLGTGSDGSAI